MNEARMPDFLVIDDDPINNMICTKIIGLSIPGAIVNSFTDPELALKYIQERHSDKQSPHGIVFLDINMPGLSGWEVLDIFNGFPEITKQHLKIYMLSSSVAPGDKEMADNHPLVHGYIVKAISRAKLREQFPELCDNASPPA